MGTAHFFFIAQMFPSIISLLIPNYTFTCARNLIHIGFISEPLLNRKKKLLCHTNITVCIKFVLTQKCCV